MGLFDGRNRPQRVFLTIGTLEMTIAAVMLGVGNTRPAAVAAVLGVICLTFGLRHQQEHPEQPKHRPRFASDVISYTWRAGWVVLSVGTASLILGATSQGVQFLIFTLAGATLVLCSPAFFLAVYRARRM